MKNILIIGCGYVGTALGQLLLAEGYCVWGLRRDPSQLPSGFSRIACDLANLGTLKLEFQPDYVFFMPSAGHHDLTSYHEVYAAGAQQLVTCLHFNQASPKRLFYISSTSVYEQNDGSWVNETSSTKNSNPYASQLLAGESVFLGSSFPTTVVRFGGIYGPGRLSLINQLKTGKLLRSLEPIYTNRIHQADCAGMLKFLMTLQKPQALYLGVDSDPALKNTVIEWIASQYGLPLPDYAQTIGPSTEQNLRSNKRCSNQTILAAGYSFQYPSFREGYSLQLAP